MKVTVNGKEVNVDDLKLSNGVRLADLFHQVVQIKEILTDHILVMDKYVESIKDVKAEIDLRDDKIAEFTAEVAQYKTMLLKTLTALLYGGAENVRESE